MYRPHLHKVTTVLLAGALAGLLLAAAALPAALLFGLGLRSFTGSFADLPESLRTPPTAQRTDLYARDGRTRITSFYLENRVDVPLAEVAPVMRRAIVAAEDIRFYQHHGVDLRGVLRAFAANRSGAARQGASTLTMQYVRNVLRSDPNLTEKQRAAATEISVGRKLQEMRYALAVEREISKDEILRRYLNIAYFGAGAYGIGAASRRYFSKGPDQLNLAEAALLAGLVRSPNTDDPINGDVEAAVGRRSYVLDQMVATGVVSAADADRARNQPVRLNPSQEPNGCSAVPEQRRDWGFFCDWFTQWWSAQPVFGADANARQEALRRGGYRIVTSLDPDVQSYTMDRVRAIYDVTNPRALPTAVVEPGTGRVRAMAVNRNYSLAANPPGLTNLPNTVNPLVAGGGTIEGYQAGSTFKLFAILAALEAGVPLNTVIDSPTQVVTPWPVSGPGSCGGRWCPVNANPSYMNGKRNMWSAFGRSVNTYFVQLTQRIGAGRVVEMAQRLGITLRAESDARMARDGANQWGPFVLGVAATTPLDLAAAYATVAAEGIYCAPTPVESITDRQGRPVPGVESNCRRVLRTDVARAATDAARCPMGDQSAFRACDGATAPRMLQLLQRPVAGKTGSSEKNATEIVVAYTPQLAVASIAANADNPRDLVGIQVQTQMVDAVAQILKVALTGQPVLPFVPPSRAMAMGPLTPAQPN